MTYPLSKVAYIDTEGEVFAFCGYTGHWTLVQVPFAQTELDLSRTVSASMVAWHLKIFSTVSYVASMLNMLLKVD